MVHVKSTMQYNKKCSQSVSKASQTTCLHAWRKRGLSLAPGRLVRLVPPRRLLFIVRVPRGGPWVRPTWTTPGASFSGRTSAPVPWVPLIIPNPFMAGPGRTRRGRLVWVKRRLEKDKSQKGGENCMRSGRDSEGQ